MTPRTLAQKLVGRACGHPQVQPGDIVTCRVDLAMMHDSGGPRRLKPHLDALGVGVWDPERIVVVTDHYVPATDAGSAQIVRLARDWVREQGIRHFYDEQGICHVVTPRHGHLHPGMFAVGGDSHSCTGGAFGAYMFGIGATEMLGVAVTGEIWLRVPHTIAMEWTGRLPDGVCAKDMMLHLCTRFGMEGGQYEAVEYCGEAVQALSMNERMTLANMTAELGGQVGLIAPDATTAQWLQDAGVPPQALQDLAHWRTDDGAPLLQHHRLAAGALAPQVSAPGSPAQAQDAAAFAHERLDIAYIGACTGAKLDDLRMAAQVLRGRGRAAPGVRLMVAPASAQDQRQAAEEGVLQVLLDAGAELLPTACGACAGYGANTFGPDTTAISTTARNFTGRMGAASSRVFLGSPYTVAASALAGRITDPREVLA
ncbi:3-isopropylmalate/(R)-2-methylmalate dehydratase large subunit [Oryzisolibacter propanilivorax]|uniref:3-isopropylmalate/(R)-2-methylmalate dehydratase large subunit n=1 Tax=Oryzisolibacter propanilivorax TaxID=1527607 RepID=A0A1G9RG30_9BURK|nr:3-isopropylmalate dehydratase large subunit [Oryzisolibacter propanilivorax]SDM21405.1 3-isopropylmalate/(R)-2-methylmalate dehydratase large subunit [Oryzisolibacter propanilivorax]